jgi:hypothetical protein
MLKWALAPAVERGAVAIRAALRALADPTQVGPYPDCHLRKTAAVYDRNNLVSSG